jgi:hypothetical protein
MPGKKPKLRKRNGAWYRTWDKDDPLPPGPLRAKGRNSRALGTNPRAKGTNPKAVRDAGRDGRDARKDGKPRSSPYAGIELLRSCHSAWLLGWDAMDQVLRGNPPEYALRDQRVGE